MLVGYARTSTLEQRSSLESQQEQLLAAGCERVFAEMVSALGDRKQLAAAMAFMRDGDTLVVTKADRLARSTAELLKIVEQLEQRGIGLVVQSMGGVALDTRSSATAKLMLTMLGAVSQFERELLLERQRDGIAKAKAQGAYKGRQPTARRQLAKIKELKAQGMAVRAIAETLKISRPSVYRLLATS